LGFTRANQTAWDSRPKICDLRAAPAEGAAAVVARVVSVVDRLEGAADTFKAAGMPFTAILTTTDLR
jgi:hypothetical protein